MLVFFANGAESSLTVFFVSQNLHASSSGYRFLLTTSGVGFAVGALLTTFWAQRLSMARIFWLSLLLAGVFELLLARQTSLLPSLVICVFQGLLYAAFNIAISPLMVYTTPGNLRGRASSVLGTLTTVPSMLSVAMAGWLDSTLLRDFHTSLLGIAFGPIDTIFTFVGAITILSGFYAYYKSTRCAPKREHSRE